MIRQRHLASATGVAGRARAHSVVNAVFGQGLLVGLTMKSAVRPQVLAAHTDVSSAVGFAYYDRYLWDGCRRVGEQDFRAMTDNAAVFLLNSRQKSGHIYKS